MTLGNRIKEVMATASPVGCSFKRFGKDNDGGYILVDDLSANDFLISMGIANDVSFEQDLSSIVHGAHMYDFSIPHLPFPVPNSEFFMEKVGSNSEHIFSKVSPDNDIILKVDIEGAEWELFANLSRSNLLRCRQIIMEIHWSIVSPYINAPNMPVEVLEKLSDTHQLVAVHPNNYGSIVLVDGIPVPQVIELTWIRRGSYKFSDESPNLKHLQMPNNPLAKEITEVFNDS